MFLLKKNMMSMWDVLCICFFFYSSLQKCVECELVIKPQNVAVLNGEAVTLNCASDKSGGKNIVWSSPTSSNFVYLDKVLASNISVSDEDDGNSSLHVNTSMSAGKRYFCVERNSAKEASAEVIILESHVNCNESHEVNKTVNVSCSVLYAGNWAPELKCEQWNVDKEFVVLEGSRTNTFANSVGNSTWIYTNNNNTLYNIYCLLEFEQSGKPIETSAMNIPKYKYRITAFYGTEQIQYQPGDSGYNFRNGFIVSTTLLVITSGASATVIGIISIKKTKAKHESGVELTANT